MLLKVVDRGSYAVFDCIAVFFFKKRLKGLTIDVHSKILLLEIVHFKTHCFLENIKRTVPFDKNVSEKNVIVGAIIKVRVYLSGLYQV